MTDEVLPSGVFRDGEIYGGLLLNIHDEDAFKPISFPFEGTNVIRGNHVKPHSNVTVSNFDYWHADHGAKDRSVFVAERGISIEGRMVGQDADTVLKSTINRILTLNSGVKLEDRGNMLDTVTNVVFPTIQHPAFISLSVQTRQPKFILFSRDIPINVSVFCDEACMLMIWTNEKDLDKRMREFYKERFVVFRMQPILNSVIVLQSLYLKKKVTRWKHEMSDRLKMLNALEAMLGRRSKSDLPAEQPNEQSGEGTREG